MKSGFVWGLALLAPLAWIASSQPAVAQGTTAMSSQKAPAPSGKAEWQDLYRALLRDATEADELYRNAKARYSKNRQRKSRRGDARDEINTALNEALIAKAKADAELADFPDLARRAGVEPGWLREVEDSAPPAQLEGAAPR